VPHDFATWSPGERLDAEKEVCNECGCGCGTTGAYPDDVSEKERCGDKVSDLLAAIVEPTNKVNRLRVSFESGEKEDPVADPVRLTQFMSIQCHVPKRDFP
jgi:hypothetical protein